MRRSLDHYSVAAISAGYGSRAVYKLQELDRKYRILRPNDTVVDLGASPGSWTLYASQSVGAAGRVLAVDLQPLTRSVAANVGFVQADILSWRPPPSLHGCVDCVLSDVMSRTTGVADIDAASSAALVSRVLVLSSWLCMPRGRVLAKVFASSHVDGLLAQFSEQFADVRVCKPAASRKESKEVYILASGKKQSIVTAARSG